MENQIEKSKSNKTIIVIIVILSLLVVGLGGYFVYDRYMSNANSEEKGNDSNKNNNDNRPAVTKIDLRKECYTTENRVNANGQEYDVDLAPDCSKYLTLNDENIDLVIKAKTESENCDFCARYMIIELNNKILFEYLVDDYMQIETIEAFNNLIVITPASMDGAEDVAPIIIINQQGNIVLDLAKVDFGKDFTYNDYRSHPGSVEIKGDKLIIKKDKGDYGGGYICENDGECFPTQFDNNYTMITKDNWNNYAERIFETIFEIEYLGNNKFSDPKKIEETKFKDKYPLSYFQ